MKLMGHLVVAVVREWRLVASILLLHFHLGFDMVFKDVKFVSAINISRTNRDIIKPELYVTICDILFLVPVE